jgi:hypothetical protein
MMRQKRTRDGHTMVFENTGADLNNDNTVKLPDMAIAGAHC